MQTPESLRILEDYLIRRGIPFDESQMDQVTKFSEFLIESNRRFNLTRITDAKEFSVKHTIDSLSVLPILQSNDIRSFVDIGTGAGIPGIIVKIFRPDMSATLVDSAAKKVTFLNESIEMLGLKDCHAIWGRAEVLSHRTEYREQFDAGLARAVADLRVLIELVLPFVRVNGILIAQKGPNGEQELSAASHAIRELGGEVENVETFALPEDAGTRSLVIIRKLLPSPTKYPRRPGIPEKRPL